jgi:hypothetical protein
MTAAFRVYEEFMAPPENLCAPPRKFFALFPFGDIVDFA